MIRKNYSAIILFTVLSIVALLIGLSTNNKIIATAGYILIAITQIMYAVSYFKLIKKDSDEINSLLTK